MSFNFREPIREARRKGEFCIVHGISDGRAFIALDEMVFDFVPIDELDDRTIDAICDSDRERKQL